MLRKSVELKKLTEAGAYPLGAMSKFSRVGCMQGEAEVPLNVAAEVEGEFCML